MRKIVSRIIASVVLVCMFVGNLSQKSPPKGCFSLELFTGTDEILFISGSV